MPTASIIVRKTTLEGIIAKDNPDIYDYDIPQSLRDVYSSKQYGRWGIDLDSRRTVPVCFIATNHTTGGNSGSPVLNGRGELIGINFDRTWLSTMSDVEFDEDMCRNIIVDIRYVLFVIDRIGGAGYLLDEMRDLEVKHAAGFRPRRPFLRFARCSGKGLGVSRYRTCTSGICFAGSTS